MRTAMFLVGAGVLLFGSAGTLSILAFTLGPDLGGFIRLEAVTDISLMDSPQLLLEPPALLNDTLLRLADEVINSLTNTWLFLHATRDQCRSWPWSQPYETPRAEAALERDTWRNVRADYS
jgi:hypothetical protein